MWVHIARALLHFRYDFIIKYTFCVGYFKTLTHSGHYMYHQV